MDGATGAPDGEWFRRLADRSALVSGRNAVRPAEPVIDAR
jgi:hypothetical protein